MPDIAEEVLACLDAGGSLTPFTSRPEGLTLPAAYRVASQLRGLREARGERHLGRKLGFTNRKLWPQFEVDAPIWGDLFDSTVKEGTGPWRFRAADAAEPKIEPEIALGLARAPEPGMDAQALMGCIGWVAHGFELVQSCYAGWRFRAPDAVAGGGLHAAYFMGPRRQVTDENRAAWQAALSGFSLTLMRDGAEAGRGQAADVLDGPLNALAHLVRLLETDPDNPPLGAGEFVTTGSVTMAFDVAAGQVWESRPEGIDLPGMTIEIV
ncbi:MAG: hydratase [Alphaproteobacteria bacterium]|nr:MAG: hydratase [Alphaproteobacteria bacterium]